MMIGDIAQNKTTQSYKQSPDPGWLMSELYGMGHNSD